MTVAGNACEGLTVGGFNRMKFSNWASEEGDALCILERNEITHICFFDSEGSYTNS